MRRDQWSGPGCSISGSSSLIKLLTTMHATNTAGLSQSAAAIGSFGTFFLGKLWDTYAPSAFKASG